MEHPAWRDAEHLRILEICHYVVAGLTALWGSIPIIHLLLGAALVSGVFPPTKSGDGPPAFIGWVFLVVGGTLVLLGWSLAVATFVAGRSLAKRRRHLYCVIVAAVMAVACVPMGTVLGVFTLTVLLRPTVKEQFAGHS